MSIATSRRTNDDALRACVNGALTLRFGPESQLADMECRPAQQASSYAADVIAVHTTRGDRLDLFLKNYGVYRNPKEQMTQRRLRELHVFRDVLAEHAAAALGTPRYYGSAWDDVDKRYWLLIEYVEADQLRNLGFEYWVPALAWIGRMQAYFVDRRHLLHSNLLLRHDDQFFGATADLAEMVVSALSSSLAARLRTLRSGYRRCVRIMAEQPVTLVHGAYRPPNVLVASAGGTLRICPVDWEEAALGSPLYDVAYLTDGFDPPRLERLWNAYRMEAERGGVDVPSRREMRRVVDAFRVHKLLNLLGKSIHRRYSPQSVETMIERAEQLSRTIE